MSIYDVVDIARWKEDNMSCGFCKEYKGIGEPCNKGITVQNLSESFNCEYYNYNGELKWKKRNVNTVQMMGTAPSSKLNVNK